MATKAKVLLPDGNRQFLRVKWLLLANGDDGDPAQMAGWPDRSVQVVGTFGAAGSVSLEGSNDGGTTWKVLTDPQGNALTFTTAGIEAVTELVHMIRPRVTAGDGTTSLNVWMMFGGAK